MEVCKEIDSESSDLDENWRRGRSLTKIRACGPDVIRIRDPSTQFCRNSRASDLDHPLLKAQGRAFPQIAPNMMAASLERASIAESTVTRKL